MAAREDGTAGECVGVGVQVGGFVGVGGVESGVVEVGELLGYGGDGGARVAGFVGVFWVDVNRMFGFGLGLGCGLRVWEDDMKTRK